uniref:Uncharacterized protein n=1 Tax=Arundo donax TaxID=35708 RepID=A0A0A9ABA7_ARUDO
MYAWAVSSTYMSLMFSRSISSFSHVEVRETEERE